MHRWHAEVVVDEELARRLLGQFPELHLDSLRPLAEGWDNAVWVANERWAFRFPRRAIAVPGVEREMSTLPLLAPSLPAPIPTPVFFGRPADSYPWPFFGSALLPGREVSDAGLDDDARVAIALELAAFLRRLHALVPPPDLPVDPNGRADMPFRVSRMRKELAELERRGLWQPPAHVERWLEQAERLPAPTRTTLAHGDLHFRHVLVDGVRLSGVIDWGDLCRADPAIDLLLFWSFVPPAARPAVLRTYGPITEEQRLRARILALFLCAVLAVYADTESMVNVKREALAGLERATAEA